MHEPLKSCPFCGTQPDECDIGHFVVECPSCAIVGPTSDNSDAARRAWNTRWSTPAGAGEVVGWMWQHEETGRTGFVDCWQVENGWQENNPRLRLVSKLFTTPQPTQAQAGFKSGAKSFQTYAEANAYSKGYYAGKKAATKAQAGAAPMSQPNRLTAYSAAEKLRELGYYWDEKAESWVRGIKGGQHGAE